MVRRYFFGAVFTLLLLPVILMVGCMGGGGQTAAPYEISSPEGAVADIFNQWRASSTMAFGYNSSGKIVAQETTGSSETIGFIDFKDLSGTVWKLGIEKVEYESANRAEVYTHYYNSGAPQFGGTRIIFKMVKVDDTWFLDGLIVTEIPAVVVTATGINGALTDKVTNLPLAGVRVEVYESSSNLLAGYAVTDAGGYYEVFDLNPGNYYMVVSRDGYAPYTISGIQVN